MADPSWRPLAGGVAQRRKERRLRSWYRHEQQTSAWPLPRSRTTQLYGDRRRQGPGRRHEEHDGLRRQKPPPPQLELFSLEEKPGGGLPAPLSKVVGKQEVLVRHVVEHMADVCPVVQTLDAPVPQMVDTVLEFFSAPDLPVAEQVIAVPKISTDRVSQRLVERRLPQMVEQLVVVPATVSYSSSREIVEQNVDIPVPHGRVGDGGLLGFHTGQSSTASKSLTFQLRVVAEFFILTSSSFGLQGTAIQGGFRTFPQNKESAHLGSHSGSELLPESSPSTPAAQREEEVDVVLAVPIQLRTPAQWARLRGLISASSQARRRKRKKRKKRRSRARRRQRQWSACDAGFTGYYTPRVMFPSVDVRPKMLCIMAGMHQEDSYAVFAGDDAPRSVPSRFHRCSSWTIYWPVVCSDRFSGPGAVLGQVLTCPLLCLTGEVGPDSTKTVELPLLQFFDGG